MTNMGLSINLPIKQELDMLAFGRWGPSKDSDIF
jgi:hypothetical protein